MPAFATLPPHPAPVLAPNDMNAANTAMLAHAGRLMALWEGGSALAVDPETLAAGQFVDWRPDVAGAPFSAHPKVEPDGTLWNIGYVPAPRPMLHVLPHQSDRTAHQGQHHARGAIGHGARLRRDGAPSRRAVDAVRARTGPIVVRPYELPRRPRLAPRARYQGADGRQGHLGTGASVRAAAGLSFPPRQRLGGNGRNDPARSLPGARSQVRHRGLAGRHAR